MVSDVKDTSIKGLLGPPDLFCCSSTAFRQALLGKLARVTNLGDLEFDTPLRQTYRDLGSSEPELSDTVSNSICIFSGGALDQASNIVWQGKGMPMTGPLGAVL